MFKVAILACVLAVASAGFLHYAAPGPIYTVAAPAPIISSSQYKAQDTLGQYTYGYATGNGIGQNEARGITGEVAGGYSYTSPEGKQVSISYTAGQEGFKAKGDAIPKAPEPTPEVSAATKEHLKAKIEAAEKAAAAPEEPLPAIAIGAAHLHAPYAAHLHTPYAAHLHAPYAGHIHAPLPYALNYGYPHVKYLIPQEKLTPPSAYSYSFSTLG